MYLFRMICASVVLDDQGVDELLLAHARLQYREEGMLMADERDYNPEDEIADGESQMPVEDAASEDVPLRSTEDFEQELEALDDYDQEDLTAATEADGDDAELESESDHEVQTQGPLYPLPADEESAPSPLTEQERLRQPRAQTFRRGLRNQVGMLPLALYGLALGGYLVARGQDVAGLPDLSGQAVLGISVLALAFTAIFHSLLSGRRERGLLFVGVYIWVTVGVGAGIVYGLDRTLDMQEWWPLLVWSLGLALVITALIERTHDSRLLLFGTFALVAGLAAYGVSSGQIHGQWFDRAADYWPVLFAIVGLGLLPSAFRSRSD